MRRFELIDGCPIAREMVPFRFPLRGIPDLTPTLKNVMNKFSVRYYIKCVLTEVKLEDEGVVGEQELNSSSYEITLWR